MTRAEQIAAATDALIASRLTWCTHSDGWANPEWQRDFWAEAAEIALYAALAAYCEGERGGTQVAEGELPCGCVDRDGEGPERLCLGHRWLIDPAGALAKVNADAWDEGHRLTPPHSDRCEPVCPNPYRADRIEAQP